MTEPRRGRPAYLLSLYPLKTYLTKFEEAPWPSGKCRGLTIQAMVLGREFKSQLHLKTRWKKIDHLMAENIMKIIKTAKWGKSHKK